VTWLDGGGRACPGQPRHGAPGQSAPLPARMQQGQPPHAHLSAAGSSARSTDGVRSSCGSTLTLALARPHHSPPLEDMSLLLHRSPFSPPCWGPPRTPAPRAAAPAAPRAGGTAAAARTPGAPAGPWTARGGARRGCRRPCAPGRAAGCPSWTPRGRRRPAGRGAVRRGAVCCGAVWCKVWCGAALRVPLGLGQLARWGCKGAVHQGRQQGPAHTHTLVRSCKGVLHTRLGA